MRARGGQRLEAAEGVLLLGADGEVVEGALEDLRLVRRPVALGGSGGEVGKQRGRRPDASEEQQARRRPRGEQEPPTGRPRRTAMLSLPRISSEEGYPPAVSAKALCASGPIRYVWSAVLNAMHTTFVLATTEMGCAPFPIIAWAPMTEPGPTLARRARRERPLSSSHVTIRSTVPKSTIPVYVALQRDRVRGCSRSSAQGKLGEQLRRRREGVSQRRQPAPAALDHEDLPGPVLEDGHRRGGVADLAEARLAELRDAAEEVDALVEDVPEDGLLDGVEVGPLDGHEDRGLLEHDRVRPRLVAARPLVPEGVARVELPDDVHGPQAVPLRRPVPLARAPVEHNVQRRVELLRERTRGGCE